MSRDRQPLGLAPPPPLVSATYSSQTSHSSAAGQGRTRSLLRSVRLRARQSRIRAPSPRAIHAARKEKDNSRFFFEHEGRIDDRHPTAAQPLTVSANAQRKSAGCAVCRFRSAYCAISECRDRSSRDATRRKCRNSLSHRTYAKRQKRLRTRLRARRRINNAIPRRSFGGTPQAPSPT